MIGDGGRMFFESRRPLAQRNPNAATTTCGTPATIQRSCGPACRPSPIPTSGESPLLYSDDAWPVLSYGTYSASRAALERFVQLFVAATIEHRCGKINEATFVGMLLSRWVPMATHRLNLTSRFLEEHPTITSQISHEHQEDEDALQRTLLLGSVEKLRSAMRDAEKELDAHQRRCRQHHKTISFAQPVAKRLVRVSGDRFSLRRFSGIEDAERLDATWEGTAVRPSGRVVFDDAVEVEADEHFTGRASGVYYGGILPPSPSPPPSMPDPCVAEHEETWDIEGTSSYTSPRLAEPVASLRREMDAVARCLHTRYSRVAIWRTYWITIAYTVLGLATLACLARYLLLRFSHAIE